MAARASSFDAASALSAFTISRRANGSVRGTWPSARAASAARSAEGANSWLGRLWQSVQSICRRVPPASMSSVTPGRRNSRTVPSPVVSFT